MTASAWRGERASPLRFGIRLPSLRWDRIGAIAFCFAAWVLLLAAGCHHQGLLA